VLRSMTSAISGMRNHQVAMDVVGTNIANVNTTGYKASRMNFKEAIYQAYSKGSSPADDGTLGGTNPIQVGLGTTMGAINTIMTQGSVMSTGRNLDLMIQGDGFFMLSSDRVAGTITPDAFSRDGALGQDSEGYLVDPVTGESLLGSDGAPDATTGAVTPLNAIKIPSEWKSFSIGADGLVVGVDGSGALSYVDAGGNATTTKADGMKIAIAKFQNPEGLVRAGGNYYENAANAGAAVYTYPGDKASGAGSIVSGSLEASNVDLAEQFSKMIMAQRGFQANSRVITTSDSMLEELVNLKR
jgi:flagellar hook protein FlgE